MRTAVDERLREESERFAFRFTCEHCAHWEGDARCSLGYPSEPHRLIDLRSLVELGSKRSIEFCKAFELA
jgi:hypothetical protein